MRQLLPMVAVACVVAACKSAPPIASPVVEGKQRVVDARLFGAVGDGQHDDLPAINRALDAVAAGGVLHLPAGIYLVSDSIRISRSRLTLSGDGQSSSILRAANPSRPLLTVAGDDFSLQDLALNGSAVDESTLQWGLFTSAAAPATGGSIRRCSFYGFNDGVKFDRGSDHWLIDESSFGALVGVTSGHGYGVLAGAAGTIVQHCTFQGAAGQGRHGVYLSAGGSDSQVTDNHIDHFNNSAIAVYSRNGQRASSRNLIARNIITGQARGPNGSAGIEVSGLVVGTRVEANLIDAPEGVGIIVADSAQGGHNEGTIVEGNRVVCPGQSGIELLGAIGARVVNNQVVAANALGALGVFGGIEINDTSSPTVASRDVVVIGNSVEYSGTARYRAAIVVRSSTGAVQVGQNTTMPGLSER